MNSLLCITAIEAVKKNITDFSFSTYFVSICSVARLESAAGCPSWQIAHFGQVGKTAQRATPIQPHLTLDI